MDALITAFHFDFMRNALAAGLLISLAAGFIGVYVVLNRIATLSGGIAHAAYGGVGIAYFLGFDPLLGGMLFSVISALMMSSVQRRTHQRSDTLIGVMWAVGMAIGILFVDRAPGYKVDLMTFLFGSILAVSRTEIILIAILDVFIVITFFAFYRSILSASYDQTFAITRNVPVRAISLIMITLIALTVVMMMRVVGLILVIALLTLPAATANLFSKNMHQMMGYASVLSAIFSMTGLWVSYSWNLTAGAVIILVAAFTYSAGLIANRRIRI